MFGSLLSVAPAGSAPYSAGLVFWTELKATRKPKSMHRRNRTKGTGLDRSIYII